MWKAVRGRSEKVFFGLERWPDRSPVSRTYDGSFFFFFNQKNPSALSHHRDEEKGWILYVRARARASVSCHLIQCIFVLRSTIVHAGHPPCFSSFNFAASTIKIYAKLTVRIPPCFRSVCIRTLVRHVRSSRYYGQCLDCTTVRPR